MDGSRAAAGVRRFVGALVLLFALTVTGAAYAASDSAETLRLDRSEGPPGTTVTATVRGYAECHAPAKTPADKPVASPKPGGGVVEIFWEGIEQAVAAAEVPEGGLVKVPFLVPPNATEQRYSIKAECRTNSKLTDDGVFLVTRSETTVPPETASPPPLIPPTVVPPETVAPETIPPATATPQLVRVPRVVRLKVTDAAAKVAAVGLVLRVTSGEGDVVASQSPSVGAMVGVGHVVRITIKWAVAPVQLVPVPNLVGQQEAGARSALSAVGLRLGGTTEADRDIVSQQPAPGTRVPAGTEITVSFANPFPWSTAAVLSLVVLAAGAVTYRVARLRLDQRWVRNKLRVVVPPAPAVDPRITESDTAPPMPVVRLEPHADAGVHILKGD